MFTIRWETGSRCESCIVTDEGWPWTTALLPYFSYFSPIVVLRALVEVRSSDVRRD
jgi:hypothetical protein